MEQVHKDRLRRWVEALRSGNFKQASGALHDPDFGYCCLGVACELSGLGKWDSFGGTEGYYIPFTAEWQRNRNYLPDVVANWYGLDHRNPIMRASDFKSLAGLNDDGATFGTIAALIEEQYELEAPTVVPEGEQQRA